MHNPHSAYADFTVAPNTPAAEHGEEMKVYYAVTLDDYLEYCLYVYKRSLIYRRLKIFCIAIVPAISLAIAFTLVTFNPLDLEFVMRLFIGGLILVLGCFCGVFSALTYDPIQILFQRWWLQSYALKNGLRGIVGQISLILSDHSLVEITEIGRSEVLWKSVTGFEDTGDHLYVQIGLLAAILPRRGFANDHDYLAVRGFLRARIQKNT
jgi:hypothetical protein